MASSSFSGVIDRVPEVEDVEAASRSANSLAAAGLFIDLHAPSFTGTPITASASSTTASSTLPVETMMMNASLSSNSMGPQCGSGIVGRKRCKEEALAAFEAPAGVFPSRGGDSSLLANDFGFSASSSSSTNFEDLGFPFEASDTGGLDILEESDDFIDSLPNTDPLPGEQVAPPIFLSSGTTTATTTPAMTPMSAPYFRPTFDTSSFTPSGFAMPSFNMGTATQAPFVSSLFSGFVSTPAPSLPSQVSLSSSSPEHPQQYDSSQDKKGLNRNAVKRWTEEEDELLRKAVELNVSKNWKAIAKLVPGRNEQQCIQRWKNVLACSFKKGPWTREEDMIIYSLIETHSKNPFLDGWDREASRILYRSAKQCRERWENVIDPSLRAKDFTKEEDAQIISLHEKFGNQWKKIATFLNGRTGNRVKSRFHSLQKKCKLFHEPSTMNSEESA